MACNYSYDPWLISLLALGIASFLKVAWTDQEGVNSVYLPLSFISIFMALTVKAVYFPIIGLLFLLPRKKFSSTAQRRLYYLAVIVLGLLVLASFALPYLFTVSSDAGDVRGGSDVNPLEQIKFILASPARYTMILTNFAVTDWLAPIHASSYIVNFAYLGNLSHISQNDTIYYLINVVPLGLIVCVGLFGGDEVSARQSNIASSMRVLFLLVCGLVLVATALYISFTPVGHYTVNGCQYRYLLPYLVPALVVVLNLPRLQVGNRQWFKYASIITSTSLLTICTYSMCLSCM